MAVFIAAAVRTRVWTGSFDLDPLLDAPDQIGTAVTGTTTIALLSGNAFDGCHFRVARLGGGPGFGVTITGPASPVTLASNSWADFVWSGTASAWYKVAGGSLL